MRIDKKQGAVPAPLPATWSGILKGLNAFMLLLTMTKYWLTN
jgi:hypothetical protein